MGFPRVFPQATPSENPSEKPCHPSIRWEEYYIQKGCRTNGNLMKNEIMKQTELKFSFVLVFDCKRYKWIFVIPTFLSQFVIQREQIYCSCFVWSSSYGRNVFRIFTRNTFYLWDNSIPGLVCLFVCPFKTVYRRSSSTPAWNPTSYFINMPIISIHSKLSEQLRQQDDQLYLQF